MFRQLAFAIALACGTVAAAPVLAQETAPASAEASSPQQIVQSVIQELNKTVVGHRQELQNDKEKLIEVIDKVLLPHFDIDYASILVLGQHAREATPEQRQRFAKAFYDSITHRYAEGLLKYTQGSVRVLPFNGDLNERRTIVRTQVVMEEGKTASVDFAFRKGRNGDWKAYDVIIEGISYVTNYRNQVDAEIRKVGIEQLIKNLETQGEKALQKMEQDAPQGGKPAATPST
ncbi:MlaC/ttg2D family ABC transporter substrate-binding protein [Aerosticca soli]|uniref:ABC transporter auxiliary component YrbC n=1 Tax=Aerosticca soli TaxID=2010829 RepID=A0A2Z6E2Y8_9GAMM|nr:ABC transporter substrate-binding protein [Aerosticca soli]MDI3262694.1 ABC transporter substrate-binding protein [Fulvimonas sp.]BBD79317.1 ABC transporter auxiliary component YrbC [Aerosticca soli]